MKSQHLISSLIPVYDALCNFCVNGSWTGDIYAIRKAIPSVRDGNILNRQLNSLQARGWLTFTCVKRSHKSLLWTVTITQRGMEDGREATL